MKKALTHIHEQRPHSRLDNSNASKNSKTFHSAKDRLVIQKRLAAKWRDHGYFPTRNIAMIALLGVKS